MGLLSARGIGAEITGPFGKLDDKDSRPAAQVFEHPIVVAVDVDAPNVGIVRASTPLKDGIKRRISDSLVNAANSGAFKGPQSLITTAIGLDKNGLPARITEPLGVRVIFAIVGSNLKAPTVLRAVATQQRLNDSVLAELRRFIARRVRRKLPLGIERNDAGLASRRRHYDTITTTSFVDSAISVVFAGRSDSLDRMYVAPTQIFPLVVVSGVLVSTR